MSEPNDNAPSAPDAAQVAAQAAQQLRQELIKERFESVATRHGLEDSAIDLVAPAAHRWLETNGKEPTKENMNAYFNELKNKTPGIFKSASVAVSAPPAPPASTSPMPGSQPSAPAPGQVDTPYSRWQALRAAGRTQEADAYYLRHARSINRSF